MGVANPPKQQPLYTWVDISLTPIIECNISDGAQADRGRDVLSKDPHTRRSVTVR